MARPTTTNGGAPEFMSSEAAGGIAAALIDLGTERFREQSAERGTLAIDQAAIDAGVRAARELRDHHRATAG
jgi:hypothetical protein